MVKGEATLVIGPGWVGDMIMAQGLLAALARSDRDSAIDVGAPASLTPLLARMPEVRSAITLPFEHGQSAIGRRIALGQSLRGCYLRAFVLPGSWKSALVPWAAGVPQRCGYLGEWRWGLINDVRKLPKVMRRRTAFAYQALADPSIAMETARLIEPRLTIDTANRDRLLSAFGLPPGRFAALAPGAEFGEAKRWPLRHWRSLCDAMLARGLTPVLLGSKGDQTMTAAIVAGRPLLVDLAGKTRLEDTIDLLSAARLAVSNDSGLMHVAAAVGCPVVAVYGSTSPSNTPPLSARARTVSIGLPCAPCHSRVCPLGHLDCLEQLDPRLVLSALSELGAI